MSHPLLLHQPTVGDDGGGLQVKGMGYWLYLRLCFAMLGLWWTW